LWWMRRPGMRRLQRAGQARLPRRWRDRAAAASRRQNRFALRWGRRIVHGSVVVVLASVAVQIVYAIVVDLALRGTFTVPDDLRRP